MGEYAEYRGEQIKIGTCEDMYYLRYDQRYLVKALSGNVDPVRDVEHLRFRFPWPSEDLNAPGDFEDYERSLAIHGLKPPSGVEHYSVQFVARAGYNVCLPCPESDAYTEPNQYGGLLLQDAGQHRISVHRNGFRGSVLLVQQKWRPGIGLVPVMQCGGCGSAYRVEDEHEVEAICVALRSEGDRREWEDSRGPNGHPGGGKFWHEIADRIWAGYRLTEAA